MSTREVIGALPISISLVADSFRCKQEKDVKKGRTGGELQARRASPRMSRHLTQNLVRVFVGAALCAALVACAAAPIPADLPAAALQQVGIYRMEIALLVFYGSLLLITPTFSGLIQGRLPIEISTRGAKFAEGSERATELDEAEIRKLEGMIAALVESLADTQIEVERLGEITPSDSRQQEVDSNHD